MEKEMVRIGSVQDGSIVSIGDGFYAYMKVCDRNGHGGVVNLFDGGLLFTEDIVKRYGNDLCQVLAGGLDEYLYQFDKEE